MHSPSLVYKKPLAVPAVGRSLAVAAGMGASSELARLLALRVHAHSDIDLEHRDPSGGTPLLCAAAKGHEACVELLLEAGADSEAADRTGHTVAHRVALGGHTACAMALANVGFAVDPRTPDGWTPFMLACRHGHAEARLPPGLAEGPQSGAPRTATIAPRVPERAGVRTEGSRGGLAARDTGCVGQIVRQHWSSVTRVRAP